jgi:protein-S-isoprenylcysteine O-methyltransferase Ste14
MNAGPESPDGASPATSRSGRARTVLWTAVFGACIGALVSKSIMRSDHSSLVPGLWLSPMAICFELWLVLSLYWRIAARSASAVKASESRTSRGLHLALVTGAQLIALWPYAGWPLRTPPPFEFRRIWPDNSVLPWLGVAVQVLSLFVAIWARRELGRHWSGEVTLKVGHELIRAGPYRRIRHPIYTGAIGMYIGPALVCGRLEGPIALALVATAYARKIRQEECLLETEFGTAYADYKRESWALIPGVI